MSVRCSQRKSVARWGRLIALHLRSGRPRQSLQAFVSMLDHGLQPSLCTFMLLFKACGSARDAERGKLLYSQARDRGLTSDPFVACSLLNMFGKCGSIRFSEELFHHVPDGERDVVFWNAMLSAYAEQGHFDKVLQLYCQILQKLLMPNHTTYAVAIRACASLAEREASPAFADSHKVKQVCLEIGQALHADARRSKLACDAMVASALTCLYGKCGAIAEAENTFVTVIKLTNIVTWTAFISACIEDGQAEKALKLYLQMYQEGITADQHVFSVVLQACVLLAEKEIVTPMDGEEIKVVPLIIAYVEHGHTDKALELYKQMQVIGIGLDFVASGRILQACGEAGQLDICRQVHFNTIFNGHDSTCFLESCFLYAYGECSCSEDALAVFSELQKPDFIAWNGSVAGYVREGNCETCMNVLQQMQLSGSMPNSITFFSILCTCSHGGYVTEGMEFFDSMTRDYGIQPGPKHHAIILDLLARVGDFTKAKIIAEQIQTSVDLPFVSCLLSACLKHGNFELGAEVFEYARGLQPHDYVVMSNLYAGSWQ